MSAKTNFAKCHHLLAVKGSHDQAFIRLSEKFQQHVEQQLDRNKQVQPNLAFP